MDDKSSEREKISDMRTEMNENYDFDEAFQN